MSALRPAKDAERNVPDHHACLKPWLDVAGGLDSTERGVGVFVVGFNAVWQRAQLTLGEVTVTAVVERVIHSAAEQHPVLSLLTPTKTGIDAHKLVGAADSQAIDAAFSLVLLELLTVLSALTADVLAPALHEALAAALPPEGVPQPDGLTARMPAHDP